MILPNTFIRPNEFNFLRGVYIDGIYSIRYCSYMVTDKKYILGIADMFSDDPNITQNHIGFKYILENLEAYEREIYKKELMKEMNITFRYIK